jgi:hypothetical protein
VPGVDYGDRDVCGPQQIDKGTFGMEDFARLPSVLAQAHSRESEHSLRSAEGISESKVDDQDSARDPAALPRRLHRHVFDLVTYFASPAGPLGPTKVVLRGDFSRRSAVLFQQGGQLTSVSYSQMVLWLWRAACNPIQRCFVKSSFNLCGVLECAICRGTRVSSKGSCCGITRSATTGSPRPTMCRPPYPFR